MVCTEHYVQVGGQGDAGQDDTGQDDSVRLCWFEWGAEHSAAGTTLLVHATGFHARCWDETIRHLGERHVVSVDMRGHGRSDKTGPYTWNVFGRDLTEFIVALDLNNLVGVGHSMGGHAVAIAASEHQSRFRRLLLVDPVIVDPAIYQAHNITAPPWLTEDGQHPVARRKNSFADPVAMFNNFHGRASYATWQDAVLRDYCKFGLLPDPDGKGQVLACPPAVEAAIYMGSAGTDVYDRIKLIETPTTILRAKERGPLSAEMDFSASPTWPALATRFVNGRDVYLPTLTHFIPMQAPELVAAHIMEHDVEHGTGQTGVSP